MEQRGSIQEGVSNSKYRYAILPVDRQKTYLIRLQQRGTVTPTFRVLYFQVW